MCFYKKIIWAFSFAIVISLSTVHEVYGDGYTMPDPTTRDWASSRANGSARVLFICSIENQYEVMALARSFDLLYDIAPLRAAQSYMDGDNYDPIHMTILRNYLSNNTYDVIVMASSGLGGLADDIQMTIYNKVTIDGVGFVYAMPGIFPRVPSMQPTSSAILGPLMPIVLDTSGYKTTRKLVIPSGSHWLSRGQQLTGMSWLTNLDSTAASGATVLLKSEQSTRILAACINRGNGRVVAYNRCYGELTYGYPFLPSLYEAVADDEVSTGKWCRWLKGTERANQFYSWLGRTILWAAKKDTPVGISSIQVSGTQLTITGFNSGSQVQACVITGLFRSPYDSNQPGFGPYSWTIPANSTGQQLIVTLPNTGYSGNHAVDVFLQNTSGDTWDWYSKGLVPVSDDLTIGHTPNFNIYTPQSIVTVSFTVTATSGNTCIVNTELYDLEDRLLVKRQDNFAVQAGVPAALNISIPLSSAKITSRLGNLRLIANTGGRSVEIRDQLFIRQEPDWNKLHVMAYAGYSAYLEPSADSMVSTLKKMGHDTLLTGFPTPGLMRYSTESGMNIAASNFATGDISTQDVSRIFPFSPLAYEMADEPELQVTPCSEGDFSEIDFRIWLQSKYASIGELNTAWGVAYNDWSQVTRRFWYEVWDSNNWAPWFDSRRQLDESYVNTWGQRADIVKLLEPNRPVSINLRAIDTFTGIDVRSFARRLGSLSMYTDYCRADSLGYLHLGGNWVDIAQGCIGYTWPTSPSVERISRELWDTIRYGNKRPAWFAPFCYETPPNGDFTYLEPNLTPNAKGLGIGQVNQEVLSSGSGDIAAATKSFDEGVFVYYPRTIFYANTLSYMKKQLDANPSLDPTTMVGLGPWVAGQVPCSFVPHLRALGYQFGFGDENDLTAENLSNKRVVFLTHAICLGEDKLELLRDFINNGGCIVAEAGTARRDGSGRVNTGVAADLFCEIFGVRRLAPNLSPVVGPEDVTNCGATKISGFSLPGDLYQKGKAFFLNFELPVTNDAIEAIAWMLNNSGVDASYSLVNNLFDTSSTPFVSMAVRTKGDIKYLFVTKDSSSGTNDFHIDFSGNQQVYDVLSHQSLGLVSEIQGQVAYGKAKLFALSPSPVASFNMNIGNIYRQGVEFDVGFVLNTQSGNTGDRLVNIEFTGPSEGVLPYLPRTIMLVDGVASFSGKIPYNGALGQYQIVVTDITSGTQCQHTFRVANEPANCSEAIEMGYSIVGDFDPKDCYVDMKDLAYLAQRWLFDMCSSSGWCDGVDINKDGKVDITDYAEFAEKWMMCIDPLNSSCDHSAWK